MAQTIHKTMTDEEYQEALDAGYPIDEDDLLPSYKKKLKEARNKMGAPRKGEKTAGRTNPLLESEELKEDRASKTYGSVRRAFGGDSIEGKSPENSLNSMFSKAGKMVKRFFNQEEPVPPPPKKPKKYFEEE